MLAVFGIVLLFDTGVGWQRGGMGVVKCSGLEFIVSTWLLFICFIFSVTSRPLQSPTYLNAPNPNLSQLFVAEMAEVERRRQMTDKEIEAEDAEVKPKEKGQMRFMQRYYHKGPFSNSLLCLVVGPSQVE